MNTAKPRRLRNSSRDAIDPVERRERNLDAFARLGMNAVAIDVVELFGRWRNKLLDESSLLLRHAHRTAMIDNVHRQRVEEFVGEEDEGDR